MSYLNTPAYAEELAELIQFKTDQMIKNSSMLAGEAATCGARQEAYDSFAKKKWLIKLEIEALKAKHRNVLRSLGVSTPDEVQEENEIWMLRVRFNSMLHAHELMNMTAGEMERIHQIASALKGSNLKAYWQAHNANCEKAIADYLAAERDAKSRLIADVLSRTTKDPSAYEVRH